MLKKGAQNTSSWYHWFLLWGNLYQEHKADHTPDLILLENCQVEPRCGATDQSLCLYLLTPEVDSAEGGQAYELAAENQELAAWLWALAGGRWPLPGGQVLGAVISSGPREPSSPQDCGFLATFHSHSSSQELHKHFGKDIWGLQVICRGRQVTDSGDSRSQKRWSRSSTT